jgi:hypothetical protein
MHRTETDARASARSQVCLSCYAPSSSAVAPMHLPLRKSGLLVPRVVTGAGVSQSHTIPSVQQSHAAASTAACIASHRIAPCIASHRIASHRRARCDGHGADSAVQCLTRQGHSLQRHTGGIDRRIGLVAYA